MAAREPAEEMAVFFDSMASTYEAHMRETIADFDRFYSATVGPVAETPDAVSVLDLGCGTGLELKWLFDKAPNAVVTGVDMSGEMLTILKRNYGEKVGQIVLVQGSYEEIELPESAFDVCLSVMSLHHFTYPRKRRIYERVRRCLKPGGFYIEGDWFVEPDEAEGYMIRYLEAERAMDGRLCHVDIPFSLPAQLEVLADAGFRPVEVFWQANSRAVLTAHKGK